MPAVFSTWIRSDACYEASVGIIMDRESVLPSQGSGSVFAARSSIENFMSWPFSNRLSGSAFMSQYWRVDEEPLEAVGLEGVDAAFLGVFLGSCIMQYQRGALTI